MAEMNEMNGSLVPGADNAMGNGNRLEQEEKTYTQEEFDKALLAESDKRVNQALENAKAEWQKDYEAKLQAEKDEAARLAKLSADERAKAEFDKEKEQFKTEREAYRKEKLEYECAKQLTDAGMSPKFASFLTGADAEATKANIDAFVKEYNADHEKRVNEQLKGKAPTIAGSEGNDSFLANVRRGAGLK